MLQLNVLCASCLKDYVIVDESLCLQKKEVEQRIPACEVIMRYRELFKVSRVYSVHDCWYDVVPACY